MGPGTQPDFLNVAVLVSTDLPPLDLRGRLRKIEESLGRVRPDANVVVDLDLCLYGSEILSGSEIAIPRPEILERAFIAVPLAELAPDFLHPVSGEALSVIAGRLHDESLSLRSDLTIHFSKPSS